MTWHFLYFAGNHLSRVTEFIRQFSISPLTIDDSFANCSATTDKGQHFSTLKELFTHCFFSLCDWLVCLFFFNFTNGFSAAFPASSNSLIPKSMPLVLCFDMTAPDFSVLIALSVRIQSGKEDYYTHYRVKASSREIKLAWGNGSGGSEGLGSDIGWSEKVTTESTCNTHTGGQVRVCRLILQ